MKIKVTLLLASLILILVTVIGIPQARTASAAATTNIRIVKYAADRSTILNETTVSIATLESTLPVRGNGTTHYYTEGPTFDPDNLWDPNEICPGDSLKDKGALKGTAISDLCSLVGGAVEGDKINVKASDGYNETFNYTNVYNTLTEPLNGRQGKMVVCWYKDGSYSGSGWTDGMLLAFFTEVPRPSDGKLIFGHQDMHDCLPENNWHYYYDGSIQYPSTHGLSIKYINEISIYSGGVEEWGVALSGARPDILTQGWFENGIACHNPPGSIYSYTDSSGNVWSGLPLWFVCGLVDDSNIHGPGSFNDNLYYDVKVSASDYNYTFPSTTIARNNDYILANKVKLAGTAEFVSLPVDKYPLKLVSKNFTTGGPSVAKIMNIDLLNISSTPPTNTPTPTPGTADWPLKLIGALNYSMTQGAFESGAVCHPAEYVDGSDTYTGIPLWMLIGFVDDSNQHGTGSFNDALATAGYRIKVSAADGYYQYFNSADVARNNNIILANKLNGQPLPAGTGDPPHPAYPLKITGSGTSGGSRVGGVVKIELVDLPSSQPAWDLNGDHACNVGDMVILGLHWGQTGTPGWIPEDLNSDGTINIGDITVLGLHWGQTW